jgi:indolepyruvate ferredoxin oxidoreductase
MMQTINNEVGKNKVSFIDASVIATNLLGDSIASNLFLLGYAYQSSLIPVSAEALNEAIGLNGVAVELNRAAFNWGRRAKTNLVAVNEIAKVLPTEKPLQTLAEIIEDRARRLIDYQNLSYAQQYRSICHQVAEKDAAVGAADQLAIAVARYLFKVMAYKDEYEVARLHTDKLFQQEIDHVFEGDYKITYHLAPPLLAKVDGNGQPVKRRMPSITKYAFQLLAPFKFLRGTSLDLFGFSADRKLDRKVIADFKADIETVINHVSQRNLKQAIELLSLPEQIRGYGHVKRKHVDNLQQRRQRLLKQIRGEILDVVNLVHAA